MIKRMQRRESALPAKNSFGQKEFITEFVYHVRKQIVKLNFVSICLLSENNFLARKLQYQILLGLQEGIGRRNLPFNFSEINCH